jgi:asparagine synthase (glutamine-hydrolysing)
MCAALDAQQRGALLSRAADAGRGHIIGFGHLRMDVGWPVDWHRALRPGARWSEELHHSRALDELGRCGDVKWTWELSRSPHVFDWVRAAVIDPAGPHGERLGALFEGFVAQCPPGRGVQWASGQEVALRALVWMWAAAMLDPGAAGWAALVKVMEMSGAHLARHAGFAQRAVPNNHVLSEALALWALGELCWWAEGAPAWREAGRGAFLEAARAQHLDDGGYCQSSHTYHRLASHLILWASQLFAAQDEELREVAQPIMSRTVGYLVASMDAGSGRLPAWGAVDGALLCPWTACDYSDMRPLISALLRAIGQPAAFEPGPWDEEAGWLALPAPASPVMSAPRVAASCHLPSSGLIIKRVDGGTFAALRCGPHRTPFGQADLGHVTLWSGGREIVCDPGSYCYHDLGGLHEYMHGHLSHNMPHVVGGSAGYIKSGRWSWLRAPRGSGSWHGDDMWMSWGADGVAWERSVSATACGWRVCDRGRRVWGRAVEARWTLDDAPWALDGARVVDQASGASVRVRADSGDVVMRLERGGRSRRYLELEPAWVLVVRVERCGAALELVTEVEA